MTPHIEALTGDYADTVLLPGDPLRAKWIAETFFEDPQLVNSVRNCLGYTGTYKGKPISVQAGGMGMPSNAIYITELFDIYNVQTIIRVGSCGGIAKHVQVGDIVEATTASTDSAMGKQLVDHYQISPSVDHKLLSDFLTNCPLAHVGSIVSNDYFYQPNEHWWRELQAHGTLAVEMETYILYVLAAQFNRKALSVNTVSDHFEHTDNTMTPKQRETGFSQMIEAVLNI